MRPDADESGQDGVQPHQPGPPFVGGMTSDEQAVYEAVTSGLDDADLICSSTKLDMARVTSSMTSLQLKGLVIRLPGNRFVPRSPQSRS
ncbi:MAG: DprA-like winged helix domain-containing protein [Planctomycetota bacterium]